MSDETLESLLSEMRALCDKLESGKLTLEESLMTFARGVEIERKVQAIVNSAERRLVQIIEADGTIKPFDVKPSR